MFPRFRLVGITAEKDVDSRVIKCNPAFLEYAGVNSYEKVIGKTDYDFPWSEYADFYRAHELDAIEGRNYSAFIPFKDYKGNQLLFLHTKIQQLDVNNNCCGILCHSVEIMNPNFNGLIHQIISSKKELGEKIFYGRKHKNIKLSPRQEEVLFFLIRGKSAKMIARLMNISYRTVEYYTEILKNKFGCGTKNELIELAINNGFSQDIPSHQNIMQLISKLNTE